jgi:predicted Zn-dependent peptidase
MPDSMTWKRNVLPNGLRVLQLPKQYANTTQLSVAVEFGSNHEPEEEAGVAHFLEHMLAGGSTERIHLSRSVENTGGILDFYTDHEHMMSTMDVLPEDLPRVSKGMAELLFNNNFEQEKFVQESKIILNEIAEVSDDPNEKIEEMLLQSLFKNHPVKRPVAGFEETVKRLTLRKLSKMHLTNYVPQNMVLILSGKFSTEECQKALENFENKSAMQIPQKSVYTPEGKPEPLVTVKKLGITQAYLSVGARTVPASHHDVATLDLMGTLLGGSTSSRLFIELREKNALTYDVVSDHCKGVDFGFLSVNCAVKERNIAKTKALIFKELCKLRAEKVSSNELERNKKLVITGILRGMDNSQDAVEILAYMERQFKGKKSLENYFCEIQEVTSKKIMDAANLYLQEDNIATAILKPT